MMLLLDGQLPSRTVLHLNVGGILLQLRNQDPNVQSKQGQFILFQRKAAPA
jgi:hypothetical protein